MWSILGNRACEKPHRSLNDLKASLIKEWDNIDEEIVHNSCTDFQRCLKAVVKAKGDLFD